MKTILAPLISTLLTTILSSCSTTPDTATITQGVTVHGRSFPASWKDSSKWISYAGRDFRMTNVLDAKLGTYGYKRGHSLDAQGDLPTGVTLRTAYPMDVHYDSLAALNKLGANVPKVAEVNVSASRERSGYYKLYVLTAADQAEWKKIIRDAVKSGNENIVDQLRRRDGYFRFVDAVLVISDFKGKRRIDGKINANASYKSVRAELDASGHNETTQEGLEPRVVGYSLRGACWGPPNHSHLAATPEDRPGAGDSGECQSEAERSPVYEGGPPPKKR